MGVIEGPLWVTKRGGVRAYLVPSGNLSEDMEFLRASYRDVRGKYPERETVPRLRDEDAERA